MRTPWILVGRTLRTHWMRSGLTLASIVVAIFLLCFLVSIVTSIRSAVEESSTTRLMTESAVSLFVYLPLDYQAKIEAIDGVHSTTKLQWFGGVYQDPENFFGQFGVDHDVFFDMYAREIEIVQGPAGEGPPQALEAVKAAFAADRRACLVGEDLLTDEAYRFKVGGSVRLQGTIFTREDGGGWDFNVVGVYRPRKPSWDARTMFFRHDYLRESLESGAAYGPGGVGVYAVNVEPGADPAQVIAAIDARFENGPQKTLTVTEAAFQQTFVSMMGNLPFFVGTIGGAVLFAVVFSVVNTMLMSARQRLHEFGILKALGYGDGAVGRMIHVESLAISLLGGAIGAGLAWTSQEAMRTSLGAFLANYSVEPGTVALGFAASAVVGLVAGIWPAAMAARLRPVEALRSEG